MQVFSDCHLFTLIKKIISFKDNDLLLYNENFQIKKFNNSNTKKRNKIFWLGKQNIFYPELNFLHFYSSAKG